MFSSSLKSALTLAVALCAAVLAVANPEPDSGLVPAPPGLQQLDHISIEKRQGTATLDSASCASNSYTRAQVDAASAEGCRLYAAGKTVGSGSYPHTFNNREGLTFATVGPYQEFPILAGGKNFTGGSPGPDRVVLNPQYQGSCVYVGLMTHTGASTTNGFVSCTETKTQASSTAGTSQGNSSAPSVAMLGLRGDNAYFGLSTLFGVTCMLPLLWW